MNKKNEPLAYIQGNTLDVMDELAYGLVTVVASETHPEIVGKTGHLNTFENETNPPTKHFTPMDSDKAVFLGAGTLVRLGRVKELTVGLCPTCGAPTRVLERGARIRNHWVDEWFSATMLICQGAGQHLIFAVEDRYTPISAEPLSKKDRTRLATQGGISITP